MPRRLKAEAGDSTHSGNELVLLSDGFAEKVNLDVAGLLGHFRSTGVAVVERMQRAKESGAKAPGRTESCARRDIGHRRDFEPFRRNTHEPHRFAEKRVMDILNVG